jgi:hypothetical protein
LKKAFIENKEKRQYVVMDSAGKEKKFSGKIVVKQSGHGYISSTELRFNAHFGKKGLTVEEWNLLSEGESHTFTLGFNYHGPIANFSR